MSYGVPTDWSSSLTASQLRDLLVYDESNGRFVWRYGRAGVQEGAEAGSVIDSGYRLIGVNGRLYRAHRLAWLYVYGEWPKSQIDHVNGNRDDNRIANLRLATWTQNHANKKRDSRNKSGFKGVSWDKKRGRWAAHIKVARKSKFLGRFDDPAEAHVAYMEAAKAYFGEFARAQ